MSSAMTTEIGLFTALPSFLDCHGTEPMSQREALDLDCSNYPRICCGPLEPTLMLTPGGTHHHRCGACFLFADPSLNETRCHPSRFATKRAAHTRRRNVRINNDIRDDARCYCRHGPDCAGGQRRSGARPDHRAGSAVRNPGGGVAAEGVDPPPAVR